MTQRLDYTRIAPGGVKPTIAISLMNGYNRLAISFRNTPQAARRGSKDHHQEEELK